MVSKKVALREAKKIRARGLKARVIQVRMGPNTAKTYMIETRTKK